MQLTVFNKNYYLLSYNIINRFIDMSSIQSSNFPPQPPIDSLFKKRPESELNKVILLFKKSHIGSAADLEKKLPDLTKAYIKQLDPKGQTQVTARKLNALFQEAYREYQRHSPSAVASLPPEYSLFARFKNLTSRDDLQKLSTRYDHLAESKKGVTELSENLKQRLNKPEPVHVKTVVVGGGDAATEYWLALQKGAHGHTREMLSGDPGAVPNTLMFAQDTGSWRHDYTLAQTYGLLERGDAPANPQDFTTEQNYRDNRHVNARFLYQANLVNLNETEAPIVLDTKVISVEKRENHKSDWEVAAAPCRLKVRVKMEQQIVKSPLVTEAASKKLFQALYGKDPSVVEIKAFSAKITPFTTQRFLELLNQNNFAAVQKELGLPVSITPNQFSKHYEIFLREALKETVSTFNGRLPKSETVRPQVDEYDTPRIINGEVYFVKERFLERNVYADQVNICGGFGTARKLSSGQVSNDIEHLTVYDHAKGFTPIVDGNSYMLTRREEQSPKKEVIIYGGGGNATACYRKAFFKSDTNLEQKKYTDENRYNHSIQWVSRDGFELAGYGRLAKNAIEYANRNNDLLCGELIKVEEGKNGKVKLYLKDVPGTYETNPIEMNAENKKKHPLQEITFAGVKQLVRVFECDQFVYTIGQDNRDLKAMFNEFTSNCTVFEDQASQMPLGVKSQDGVVQFWGANAIVASPSAEIKVAQRESNLTTLTLEAKQLREAAAQLTAAAKTEEEKAHAELKTRQANLFDHRIEEARSRKAWTADREAKNIKDWTNQFSDRLRDWIVVQRIARDAEWPGVMPPSRVSARQAAFLERNQLVNQRAQLEQEVKVLRQKVDEAQVRVKGLPEGSREHNAAQKEKTRAIAELEKVKASLRTAQSEFTSVNVNLDNIDYINGFLVRAGVDDAVVRTQFLSALLAAREEAHAKQQFSGISQASLDSLIQRFGLQEKITRQGHFSLTIKRH